MQRVYQTHQHWLNNTIINTTRGLKMLGYLMNYIHLELFLIKG